MRKFHYFTRTLFVRQFLFFMILLILMLTSFRVCADFIEESSRKTYESSHSKHTTSVSYPYLYDIGPISIHKTHLLSLNISSENPGSSLFYQAVSANSNVSDLNVPHLEVTNSIELIEDAKEVEITEEKSKTEIVASPIYSEDDLKLLATTIYFEASPNSDLEGMMAVGWVVENRLNDVDTWHASSYSEIIYMENPTQFAVTLLDNFESYQEEILEDDSERAKRAVEAAQNILEGTDLYKLPEDVQFFYGDMDKRYWGSHTYFDTLGGNSFFYK